MIPNDEENHKNICDSSKSTQEFHNDTKNPGKSLWNVLWGSSRIDSKIPWKYQRHQRTSGNACESFKSPQESAKNAQNDSRRVHEAPSHYKMNNN